MLIQTPTPVPAAGAPSILSKAFDLLRAFNAQERVMTLSELARASRLPKSTVHRLLARLIELDAVEHLGDGYRLSVGLIQLSATTPAASLRDLAMPYLAGLHRWTGETVHLGVLRQFDVVYLEKLARSNSPVLLSRVGARLPANCTAIGKALLAWEDLDDLARSWPRPMPMLTQSSIRNVDQLIEQLRDIKDRGIAREHDEAQPGLACVAAPVVVDGFALGAVSIGYRSQTALHHQVEAALRVTAGQIARESRAWLANGQPDYRVHPADVRLAAVR
jgi:DNA-binding IclR family transcriptional regulator